MTFKPSFIQQAVGGALMCATVGSITLAVPAWAAGPATANAPGAAASAAHSAASATASGATAYTSKAGDTLNKIVHSHYKDSPLQASVLVKAVRQLNPTGLPAKADQRLKVGTALQLPSHVQVVRDTLQAVLPEGHAVTPNSPPLSREHWVRFP
jgi:Tfp pilus assembly protein FimV